MTVAGATLTVAMATVTVAMAAGGCTIRVSTSLAAEAMKGVQVLLCYMPGPVIVTIVWLV